MATNTIAINLSKDREDIIYRLNVLKFILIGNVDHETIDSVDLLITMAETSTTFKKLINVNSRANDLYEQYKTWSAM